MKPNSIDLPQMFVLSFCGKEGESQFIEITSGGDS